MARAPAKKSERTASKQREIQRDVARKEKKRKPGPKPMQAGSRKYPEPPLPKQHQSKPGEESKLQPRPMFDAPYYKGSEKLLGKVAIVTGGDSGIGRSVAVLFAHEGADVDITGEILPVIGGYGH